MCIACPQRTRTGFVRCPSVLCAKKVTKLRKNRPTALIIQYFVRIHKMRILSLWLAVHVCVQTVLASQNATSSSAAAAGVDEVYAMSSLDLSDVMDDFSQMNVLSVVVACLLMVHTHTHTQTDLTDPTTTLNRVPASAGVRAGMSPLPGGR